MQKYELWLDESGNFESDDQNPNKMPSFVGGLLVEAEKRSLYLACAPGADYHSYNENALEKYTYFQSLVEAGARFVLFENKNRLHVINDKITYLSVISEGILQLVDRLLRLHGKGNAHLEIRVAARRDNPQTQKNAEASGTDVNDYANRVYIGETEYLERLREKVLLGGNRYNIDDSDWSLVLDDHDATKTPEFKLADIVCNVILTRRTAKMSVIGPERLALLNQWYEDDDRTWKFEMRDYHLNLCRSLLAEDRLGEAVVVLCQSGNRRSIEKGMKDIRAALRKSRNAYLDLQFAFITDIIQYYLVVSRDFKACIQLLNHLEMYFHPALQASGNPVAAAFSDQLKFEILFSKETVYTHMGNLRDAEKNEQAAMVLLAKQQKNPDTILALSKFRNRRIISLINRFDLESAEQECQRLISQNISMKEALNLSLEESEDEVKYPELGKAYGTMLQILTMKLRKQPELYAQAQDCSERAIREFDRQPDIDRQCNYRAQAEIEAGHMEAALDWLCRSCHIEHAGQSSVDSSLIARLADKVAAGSPFDRMTYMKLIAEGKHRGFAAADELFTALEKLGVLELPSNSAHNYHPDEIYYWKCASYLVQRGRYQDAVRFYQKAEEICYSAKEPTLFMIGLGIELEHYAMLLRENRKEQKELMKRLIGHWKMLEAKDLPDSMKTLFGKFDKDCKDPTVFYRMSRQIVY